MTDHARDGCSFAPIDRVRVKLEGAGKIGERYVGVAGIRDPYTIANIDRVIAWAREQARGAVRRAGRQYNLYYTVRPAR